MSKKDKKKGKKKFRIFLLVIGFLLIFSFAFVMLGAYVFKINTKAIIIKGNDALSDEIILKEAGLEDYPNFFLTSSSDVSKKLKDNAFIKNVAINKTLFFQISIDIEEYKPLFIREDTNKIVLDNEIAKVYFEYYPNFIVNRGIDFIEFDSSDRNFGDVTVKFIKRN